MRDIERARQFLKDGATFALVNDVEVFSTDRGGIAPLLELAEQGKDLTGFSAADKIVGKAAALLYCNMNISEVYAEVISHAAVEVFERFNRPYSYNKEVEYIINRKGDGMCPMEQAVRDISDPAEAVRALRAALDKLTNKK